MANICTVVASLFMSIFPGSAHAVVIRAAMLFVVQFPVIEYNCFSY